MFCSRVLLEFDLYSDKTLVVFLRLADGAFSGCWSCGDPQEVRLTMHESRRAVSAQARRLGVAIAACDGIRVCGVLTMFFLEECLR